MQINEFIEEVKKINIDITEKQLFQLEKYYNLLIEENEKINLTSITKKEDVYLKHYYDSLTLNKIINLKNVEKMCDIGTGAGFPGIVIKILFPNIKVTLVDSLNKRIEFLKKVINELELQNIEAIHSRIEEYGIKNREKFDLVTARAVASLNILLEYSIPLVKEKGYFVAMKSNVDEELKNINYAMKELSTSIDDKIEFTLPIEERKRTLIKFLKEKETNKKYPRKYSIIKQRPL